MTFDTVLTGNVRLRQTAAASLHGVEALASLPHGTKPRAVTQAGGSLETVLTGREREGQPSHSVLFVSDSIGQGTCLQPLHQFSLVRCIQSKVVSQRLEKPVCAPPHLSEVP